jgi:hypothetical protein
MEVVREDLSVRRAPDEVLQEAHKAAAVLHDVISKKRHPVKFNGRQYLEFEDWQTVGRFYGLTARVRESKYVEYGDGKGFEAIADAIMVSNGQIVSTAEAMCLNDEKNWKTRTLNQIRSMAQTRACAKALRNVLSWVVVLAGYAPTPAEEMDRDRLEEERQEQQREQDAVAERRKAETAPVVPDEIRTLYDRIQAKGGMKECFAFLQNEAVKAAGRVGEEIVLAHMKAIRERYPEGIPPLPEVQRLVLVLWNEVERLRTQKAMEAEAVDESAGAFAK